MRIEKYSFGCGDRFLHQGKAQLQAILKARQAGIDIVPVWNKSNREHTLVGTQPPSLAAEASAAVRALGYNGSFYIDADHINLKTVDAFIESHSFFTLDLTDYIGQQGAPGAVDEFIESLEQYIGDLDVDGLDQPVKITRDSVRKTADKFLFAISQGRAIYDRIAARKGADNFVTEISVDETDHPQTPEVLFVILAAIAKYGIPVQTIAPKFTGRFNKGVDYVGDLKQFERELHADLAVINYAIEEFNLPDNLKLSVHSGSDKFSIYPIIREGLQKFGAGVHIKTAGTTWLEELIGLAEGSPDGLKIAKEIYAEAFAHAAELIPPYASVIDINEAKLPKPETVNGWDGKTYAETLRHDQKNPLYNQNFRQLLHIGYKVAAKMGDRYTKALEANEASISRNVTTNLFDRHLKPLFLDESQPELKAQAIGSVRA